MTRLWHRFPRLVGSLGLVALMLGAAIGPPAHADSSAQSMSLYFTGTVLQGTDAGVRLEGLLSLTPGSGAQVSGTLATFGGTIMNSRTGYTPIPVAGHLQGGTVALTFDLSGLGKMSMDDANDTMLGTTPLLMKLAWPAFKHSGAHMALQGSGRAQKNGDLVGTFSGPANGDTGIWTAAPGAGYAFDLNARSSAGTKLSLSGQAAVVFEASGTVEGLYVSDDGKTDYPVHGIAAGNWLSLVLEMGNSTYFFGTGSTGNVDTFQFYTGTFYGPDMTTTGKWTAAFS